MSARSISGGRSRCASGGLAEEILKIVLDLHEAESKN